MGAAAAWLLPPIHCFPRTAILQRLSWAGADRRRTPFALIPDYETFHFAKPNPAFYAELLARLDWPEGPVVMVGDTLDNDIARRSVHGLVAAFWITKTVCSLPQGALAPNGAVPWQMMPWLEMAPFRPPNFNTPPAVLAILTPTPAVLHGLRKEYPLEECAEAAVPTDRSAWRRSSATCATWSRSQPAPPEKDPRRK